MKTVTGDYRYENFLYQRVFEYAEYAILNGDDAKYLQDVCRDEKNFLKTLYAQICSKYVSNYKLEHWTERKMRRFGVGLQPCEF